CTIFCGGTRGPRDAKGAEKPTAKATRSSSRHPEKFLLQATQFFSAITSLIMYSSKQMLLTTSSFKTAFSLVEVVVALAVASFVLLVLVGTLPSGMKVVQDSMSESAQANITQQVRAQLEQITFNTSSTSTTKTNIFNLNQQTNYY